MADPNILVRKFEPILTLYIHGLELHSRFTLAIEDDILDDEFKRCRPCGC